jgi:hypothetical protein
MQTRKQLEKLQLAILSFEKGGKIKVRILQSQSKLE